MNRCNQLPLPNPCIDLWNDIQNTSTGSKDPVAAITNHGRKFWHGVVFINHSKRGDDIGNSDKSIFDESLLKDSWIADFNCNSRNTHFHGCPTQGATRTGIVNDYLALTGRNDRSIPEDFVALPCVWYES